MRLTKVVGILALTFTFVISTDLFASISDELKYPEKVLESIQSLKQQTPDMKVALIIGQTKYTPGTTFDFAEFKSLTVLSLDHYDYGNPEVLAAKEAGLFLHASADTDRSLEVLARNFKHKFDLIMFSDNVTEYLSLNASKIKKYLELLAPKGRFIIDIPSRSQSSPSIPEIYARKEETGLQFYTFNEGKKVFDFNSLAFGHLLNGTSEYITPVPGLNFGSIRSEEEIRNDENDYNIRFQEGKLTPAVHEGIMAELGRERELNSTYWKQMKEIKDQTRQLYADYLYQWFNQFVLNDIVDRYSYQHLDFVPYRLRANMDKHCVIITSEDNFY